MKISGSLLAMLSMLAFLLASACGDGGEPAATDSAATTGKMAFGSERDGNLDIYVMNADGSGAARLTNNPGQDGFPAWSPAQER